MSYGTTSNILEEILPLHVNVLSTFYTTHKVAKQLDAEIEAERHCFIDSCENDWNKLPSPDTPLTVGIDRGYIHAREGNNRRAGWFEAIVGKSLHETQASKRFGFVCKYDDKPKSRLNSMLKKQGFQMNQDIIFLSDGSDTVRDLQHDMAPNSEHLLDWFHIIMKITIMKQMISGLEDNYREQSHKKLESIKWNLWHGNAGKALDKIESFSEDFYDEELDKANVDKIDKNSNKCLINRRIYEGVKRAKELGKYKGRTHSVDKTIRAEYVKMMQSGNYAISYRFCITIK